MKVLKEENGKCIYNPNMWSPKTKIPEAINEMMDANSNVKIQTFWGMEDSQKVSSGLGTDTHMVKG